MKKTIFSTLTVLLLSFTSYAQQELNLVNQTDCTLEYLFNSFDSDCLSTVTTSYTVGPNSSLLATAPGGRYFYYVEITEINTNCFGVALEAPSALKNNCVSCYTPLSYVNSSETISVSCACQETFYLDWSFSSCQYGEVVVK